MRHTCTSTFKLYSRWGLLDKHIYGWCTFGILGVVNRVPGLEATLSPSPQIFSRITDAKCHSPNLIFLSQHFPLLKGRPSRQFSICPTGITIFWPLRMVSHHIYGSCDIYSSTNICDQASLPKASLPRGRICFRLQRRRYLEIWS